MARKPHSYRLLCVSIAILAGLFLHAACLFAQELFEVRHFAGSPGGLGSADGVGAAARFQYPSGLWGDGTYLYISDQVGRVIRRVTIATGEVQVIAGSLTARGSTDGVGTAARFNNVIGLLSPEFYLKEARFEQIDVLNQPMRFSGGSSGVLDVVISPGAAQVTGRVVNAKDQPVPGITTVLIPDRQRHRFELYKTTSTDQNGAFTIRGVPPGDYKVFSWEALESFAFYDPAVLQQFEQRQTCAGV